MSPSSSSSSPSPSSSSSSSASASSASSACSAPAARIIGGGVADSSASSSSASRVRSTTSTSITSTSITSSSDTTTAATSTSASGGAVPRSCAACAGRLLPGRACAWPRRAWPRRAWPQRASSSWSRPWQGAFIAHGERPTQTSPGSSRPCRRPKFASVASHPCSVAITGWRGPGRSCRRRGVSCRFVKSECCSVGCPASVMSRFAPARPCSKRCANAATTSSRSTSIATSMSRTATGTHRCRAHHRAPRSLGRGWLRPGAARDARHPLHRLRRARVGARDGQGEGQGAVPPAQLADSAYVHAERRRASTCSTTATATSACRAS